MNHNQIKAESANGVMRIVEDSSVLISAPTRKLMCEAIDNTPGFHGAIHHTPKYGGGPYNAIVEISH